LRDCPLVGLFFAPDKRATRPALCAPRRYFYSRISRSACFLHLGLGFYEACLAQRVFLGGFQADFSMLTVYMVLNNLIFNEYDLHEIAESDEAILL